MAAARLEWSDTSQRCGVVDGRVMDGAAHLYKLTRIIEPWSIFAFVHLGDITDQLPVAAARLGERARDSDPAGRRVCDRRARDDRRGSARLRARLAGRACPRPHDSGNRRRGASCALLQACEARFARALSSARPSWRWPTQIIWHCHRSRQCRQDTRYGVSCSGLRNLTVKFLIRVPFLARARSCWRQDCFHS